MKKLTIFAAWVGGALLAGILLLFFPEYFIAVFVVGVSAVSYVYGSHGENQTSKYVVSEQTDEYVESEEEATRKKDDEYMAGYYYYDHTDLFKD